MTEIAFLVKPDSEMYRKYFKQKNELDKFVGFASSFIDKYFVSRNKDFDYSFSTNMRLTVKLPPNDEEWFGAQLMKEKSESGLCVFKKNSPMNKRWHEEVTSHIDPYSLTASNGGSWIFRIAGNAKSPCGMTAAVMFTGIIPPRLRITTPENCPIMCNPSR